MIWLVFCGVIVCFFIWVYNKVIRLKNLLFEAQSGVEVQLKRRYDLVPNLVKVVSSYCKQERGVFENVAKYRSQAMSILDLSKKESYENTLEKGLCSLLMLKEAYPELKASDIFLKLQQELVVIEDDLQYARRYYNGVVRNFNTFISLFPICLFQKILKVSTKPFFQLDGVHEKDTPSIKACLND